MVFALIFSLLLPVFAAPTKSFDPNTIQSFVFRSEYLDLNDKGPFIKQIIEAHEAAFPGAFKHTYINYYTSLRRLSYVQQGLVASIMQEPEALKLFEARPPMADITVTVEKPFTVGSTTFLSYMWNSFKNNIIRKVKYESAPDKNVSSLLEIFRQIWWEHSARALLNKDSWFLAREYGVSYVFVHSLARENPKMKVRELVEKLEDLEVSSLDYIEDEKNFMPILTLPIKDTKTRENAEAIVKEQMGIAHDKIIHDIYSKGFNLELKTGDSITMREVHPNIAIFRGYVGNDCSTSFSPGFVFTPFDRYFYVYEGDEVLGYVGISMVKVKNENTVFLHTIQGPDFTESQTELVIRGLKKSLSAFNATKLVLGKDSNIDSNVNFEPIRQTMVNSVKGAKPQPVTWLDSAYREYIGLWDSTMEYDDPKKNKEGREPEFDDSIVGVKIKQTPFEVKFTQPTTLKIKNLHCELKLISRSFLD